ncbi:MAG: dihydroneopterin aldolase [Microcoleaceae cyanobacterium]
MGKLEQLGLVHIENLRLRTIIGFNDWEREKKQDVKINIKIRFDAAKAGRSDCVEDTVNYKTIAKRIIETVEQSQFYLVEKLAQVILDIAMENPQVVEAWVKVEKPFALRFADSVSIELSAQRNA